MPGQAPPSSRACPRARDADTAIRLRSFTPPRQQRGALRLQSKLKKVPRRNGRDCGATPRLAAAGCAKACRPRRWRFAPVRHEGRFTDTPPGLAMEHPRHASSTWPQSTARGVLACRWGGAALPASGRKPVKPSRGDTESAISPFGSGRPVRPWLVVNPGEGTAAPWAS